MLLCTCFAITIRSSSRICFFWESDNLSKRNFKISGILIEIFSGHLSISNPITLSLSDIYADSLSASYFSCEYTRFKPSEPAALHPSMSFPGKSFESLAPSGQLIFSLLHSNRLTCDCSISSSSAKSSCVYFLYRRFIMDSYYIHNMKVVNIKI